MKKSEFLIFLVLVLAGVLLFVMCRGKKIDLERIVRFAGFKK